MKTKKAEKGASCEVMRKEFFEKKDESLIFQFHHIHNAMFRIANKKINASSVPVKMEQLPVLMTLYWLKEQSQQQVADHINRDKSSVLRTVLALEKKGLIVNKKDDLDNRRKVLTLTDTGKFVAIQIVDLIKEIEIEIVAALTERPKSEFVAYLKKAGDKLDLLADS
jgi:DNA-binding MarR family transcriptional regulator